MTSQKPPPSSPTASGWFGTYDLVGVVGVTAALEVFLASVSGEPLPLSYLASAALFAALLAALSRVITVHSVVARSLLSAIPALAYGLWIMMGPFGGRAPFALFAMAISLLMVVYLVSNRGLQAVCPRTAGLWLSWSVFCSWGGLAAMRHEMPPTTPLVLFIGAVIVTVVLGRWSIVIVLATLNFSTSSVEWTDKPVDETKPDILLVTIDTLRLDTAKGMSVWKTLAEEGIGYDAQASSPWTLPSMASIMTGLEPFRHGAGRTPEGYTIISQEEPTLAELLRNEGYDTAATVHSPFMDARFGFSRGFDQLRNEQYDLWVLPAIINSTKTQPLGAFLAQELGIIDDARTHSRARVLDARDFVDARRDDHPMFLWVHMLDAHVPYRHGSELDLPFTDRWLAMHADYADLGPVPTPHELEVLRAAYLHEVRVVDAAVTEILGAFSARDRGRVVVVSSDHGEEFGEHEGWEHGHTLYQELLAVPLVITGIEGLKPGDAGLIDITPTLLSAAGVSAFGFDGRDLKFKAHNPPYRSVNPLYGDMFRRAVKVGDQKVIAEGDARLQFDLSVDAAEKAPKATDENIVAELPPEELGGGAPVVMDKRTKAALEALGYLD